MGTEAYTEGRFCKTAEVGGGLEAEAQGGVRGGPQPPEPVRTGLAASLGEMWRGTWLWETWGGGAGSRLVLSFAGLALCSWLGIVLSRQSGGVATIWLSNGILFGLLVTQPRGVWLGYFLAGLAADTIADMVYGDPFRLAAGVSLANSVEVVTATLMLTQRFGLPFDLSKRRPLVGFLLVGVGVSALMSSAIGASWTLLFVDAGSWRTMFRTWYLGDMLGMAILGPVTFMLQRRGLFSDLGRRLPETSLLLLLSVLTTLLVFTHESDPFTFLLFPVLLVIVFRLGFPGTVPALFAMAMLTIGLTVKGHGPLMLLAGENMMLHRIVVVQILLAVAIFTMFPVAALLEERKGLQDSLRESEARHRHLANADDLTGLWNRRAFNRHLDEAWRRAGETQQAVAMLLLDADLFKTYNDLYGHLDGDECLRCLAAEVARTMEGVRGFAARFGGEEFAIILTGEEVEDAYEVAERIRTAVLERGFPHAGALLGVQTVSIGVAAAIPGEGESMSTLVVMADRALYRAKDLGRNRVVEA